MINKIYILLLLLSAVCFAQHERQLLYGKVISDVLKIENLSVKNLTAKKDTLTKGEGNFVISATVNDTLRFEGVLIETLDFILQPGHFKEELFVVRVMPEVTMLKEVVVSGLTGNLAVDSKKTKVMLISSQFDAAQINKDVVQSPGFIGLITLLTKKKPQKKMAKSVTYKPVKSFPLTIRERYDDDYFTKTLFVPTDDIMKFLYYCNEGNLDYLLNPDNEFQLLQYLNSKSIEYLKNKS
ncbi:hypothetical protein GWA97_09745 [Flavobacterium sp. LaA7.5]|nr:hypothetical protein [Flavobacterium salilacus subsp. altitudinum]